MFSSIPNDTKQRLWKHQVDALDFAIDHLNKWNTPCLIRMPTGTGKTGIIACLTQLSNQGASLVLTPWAHLRNQMISDLEKGFWKKVELTPKKLEVVSMFPSTAYEILKSNQPQIIVSTFATLNDLRNNYFEIYENLSNSIQLVIVDEGHYEPAVEWGKSVRDLKTKTVLLTATPYRNDLKLFRITDPKRSTSHFTHKQAVDENIIRKIKFDVLSSQTDIPSLSGAFTKKWLDAKKNNILPSREPRAIICCSCSTDIEIAVSYFRGAGLKAIGIHDQFDKSVDPYLFKEVPDPRINDSEIWVHQYKLTEGLDDNRFCCIGLFTPIHNDRRLIQQIGRVLRWDDSDRNNPAVFFAPSTFSAENEWNAYLEFETNLELLDPQHFRNIVDTLLSNQPSVEYFEGRFRRRFNPAELSQTPQVIIPPSVLVRVVSEDFLLDDYIEYCTDTLNIEDAVILGRDINAPCQKSKSFALWVYASVRNSHFLQDTSLYEIKLETHCVVHAGGFLFMTDSRGIYPSEYLENHTTSVSAEKLTRYLDFKFRPTNISINSSIPYDTVVRGANLRGHNLLGVPASLTDHVQICNSVRGSSKDYGRRYIGINNGRVRSEISSENLRRYSLNTFISWAENIAEILNSTIKSSELFDRYMMTCKPPEKVIPRTICIDLLRRHDLSMTLADGRECWLKNSSANIEESASDVNNKFDFSFELEGVGFNNMSISFRIEYDPLKQRFWFYKEKGQSVVVSLGVENESTNKGLAEFLNQNQDIILIGLSDGEIVYQGRNFYKIDYSYAENILLDLIKRPKNGTQCKTEKGSKEEITALKVSNETNFPIGSLFRFISDRLPEFPFEDDVLICDDLGSECADFIAANIKNHQLALIHAKAGGGSKISASSFHDVVAQAMKNLVYITKNSEIPNGVNSWRKDSKWNKTKISRLYRIPDGFPSCKTLWDKLKSDIINSSNPDLYVILVTTGCCDLFELKQAVNDPKKRTPEIAQLLHLLDGLNGYARQLGVKLIIYDFPFSE